MNFGQAVGMEWARREVVYIPISMLWHETALFSNASTFIEPSASREIEDG